MDYRKIYDEWRTNKYFDENVRGELNLIKNDDEEVQDRFYKELEFGTAGLRGKLGAGTNRMNKYVVLRATKGLADFICEHGESYMDRGVVIAYDCRRFSKEFAKSAALVLAANNIKVYIFESLRPTPVLSFAVRQLNASAGIMITASHNPKEYNGYKVFWEDGAQIGQENADAITESIVRIKNYEEIEIMNENKALEKGILSILGTEIDDLYVSKVKTLTMRDDIDKSIKVVYTPLNGTGNVLVRRVLRERGFTGVEVVKEQENPDPDFTTAPFPNPEDIRAFEYAEKLGSEIGAELLLATDPDCDRLAVAVRDKNDKYRYFNGNQTGALLIKYILESRKELGKLPCNGFVVKSIVTGDLGKVVAEKYGIKTFEALTGFKNICGKANELEKNGECEFLFGYEESIGYVAGDFVKDKDAVIASMIICEAAAYYKEQGKNLVEILEEIYKEFGYYKEKQISIVLEGAEGSRRIKRMMEVYRKEYLNCINRAKLVHYLDYKLGKDVNVVTKEVTETEIPISDVLKFTFDDDSWYAIRPSGTEPKIKLYVYSKGDTEKEAEEKLDCMTQYVLSKLNSIE